jgi:hypothetical protein
MDESEFIIEYSFEASADAEERLAEAYDLILVLILKELQPENKDGETCSTPSA